MTTKPCPTCKHPLDFNAIECPQCGRPDPFYRKKNKESHAALRKIAMVIAAIIGVIYLWFVAIPDVRNDDFSGNFFQKQ